MTYQELNNYILHYITDDKTKSAIMLTGDWGVGKSYYIQNSLKSFLENEEKEKHQCVVVSLYGLKDLSEISKSIYFELRIGRPQKWIAKKIISRFSKNTPKISKEVTNIGKTVLKGLMGKVGINFDISEKNLNQLYSSINLNGKLIILEDLERSGIDVLDVLGYVDNLVEQDGGKVLLVANEGEIIKKEEQKGKDKNGKEIINMVYTECTKQYLRKKEKTVGDIIAFAGDFSEAINQIIQEFNNEILSAILTNRGIKEIIDECRSIGIKNLRTFVFACQKTTDIFKQVDLDYSVDADYIDTVFFGILAFAQGLKNGKKIEWKDRNNFSVDLGSEEYPLFRSCYDYVMWHFFDASRIDSEKEALKKLRLYDKKKSWQDKDLIVLYNWWIHSEKDVNAAIMSVSERLKDETDISFYEYGSLAVYLIAAKNILGCDIEAAKELLIKNLHNKGMEINADYIFTTRMSSDEKPEVIEEYEELKALMKESLNSTDTTIFNFDYCPSSIALFNNKAITNSGKIIRYGGFANRLDIKKICEMLKECSAEEIQDFRAIFIEVYRSVNIREFLPNDEEAISQLLTIVNDLKNYSGFDKIQKLQICFFSENLSNILQKL